MEPQSGSPAVLVSTAHGAAKQVAGVVTSTTGAGIAVRLAMPSPLRFFERALLVVGIPGSRQVARVRQVGAQGLVVVLERVEDWRPFVVRDAERYQTDLAARVYVRASVDPVAARVLDLGSGGAAVSLAEPVEAEAVDLSFGADDFQTMIRCRVVGTRGADGAQVLHLAFQELEEAGARLLQRLLATLAARRESDQAHDGWLSEDKKQQSEDGAA